MHIRMVGKRKSEDTFKWKFFSVKERRVTYPAVNNLT